MRAPVRRHWRHAVVALLIPALLAPTLAPRAAFAQSLPSLGQSSASDLSPATERRLGERIMREIRADPDYLADLLLSDYINMLGGRLVAATRKAGLDASQSFEFFVVRDARVNAFSLPGGFIGINTGLIVTTRTESELASVVGHETGHVLQHHIARMVGQSGQNAWLALGGILLGILAGVGARSADLGLGIAMGGQGLAVDRQLRFSRDAEREADRVGFQLLQAAGFDTYGMPAFFERLQRADSINEAGVPEYVRTHPLTTERIADMLNRARNTGYRQPEQSHEYAFVRARSLVLQQKSASDYAEIANAMRSQIRTQTAASVMGAWYAIALAEYKQQHWDAAREALTHAQQAFGGKGPGTPSLVVLDSDIARASGRAEDALRLARAARETFPLSQAADMAYADALIANRRVADASQFLQQQVTRYRSEPVWWRAMAGAYAAAGKRAKQHEALAEQYALQGQWMAAVSQLKMARAAGDADFYELSTIDARLHEFERRYKEDKEEQKELKQFG
ncbi:peptidase M48 [Pandoraea terrae]|uniref:Peptidase M48 n=1 Tax=Pandoraea terrae TaxID=1537710 RepID=A0A5E4UV67_9BURK|nr:M48 family metalloprotease [Pandoraea terrae]VVE02959.1 peptidase M48 [Pandoraea terrae]